MKMFVIFNEKVVRQCGFNLGIEIMVVINKWDVCLVVENIIQIIDVIIYIKFDD